MAALTLYFKDVDVVTGGFTTGSLQDGGTAPSVVTSASGWVVAKHAVATAQFNYGGKSVSTVFDIGTDANIATESQLRTQNSYNGTFASGTWTTAFSWIAVSSGGAQDGRFHARVWQSTDPRGLTGALDMASGGLVTSTIATNLATSAAQNLTASITINQNLTLTNAYLFVSLAWEITGAGTNNNADVVLRQDGTNSKITTTNFTPLVLPPPKQFIPGLVALQRAVYR